MTSETIKMLRYCLPLDGETLEVGSLDINGSCRHLFKDYVGVDMMEGPNVDIVANGHALPFPNERFDVVLSLNTLEHDECFWLSVAEMRRVLKPGGTLFIEVPNFLYTTIHNHPSDYYRFSHEALRMMLMGYDKIDVGLILGRNDLSFAKGVKPL